MAPAEIRLFSALIGAAVVYGLIGFWRRRNSSASSSSSGRVFLEMAARNDHYAG